ncbi:helix-turn-helix transcriptional regulator [Pseudodonghicola flavimaris]|uniref:Helix-turn-helix transcriptional regulator n=1 Tax=Pseudodonghicola flavimaris TaxID=3050036 RepID=A0ABT7EYQ0_9RHOB|nr:helix-turn-helix transcriptional regulator [Pseudodonghicola flavimaris]MDK3017475.1 helix-turn-helix transcriptional regulator [Pseudodonghicola flavimaris]
MAQISLGQIERSLPPASRDFGATLPPESIVLSGGRIGSSTPSGLVVNLQATRGESDFETRTTRPANVVLHMVLEGGVDTWLGAQPMPLGRPPREPVRVVMSALAQPMDFRRRVRRGQHLRKLTVVLSWDWLEARGVQRAQLLQGQRHRSDSWIAAPGDVARAEALLAAPDGAPPGPLLTLEKEALAMSLVRHAMELLLAGRDRLKPQDREKLSRMEALATRPGPLPALEDLAAAGGVSLSTMRRLFRRAYDQPVQERLRALRMDRAADALRAGAPVAEAARLAGYERTTAFATAFRQRMGTSPSRFAQTAD